jgi:4-amino-4-deoxy-L-arabinose transferase-like glycosyltransferase
LKLGESPSRLLRAPDAAALVIIATSLLVRLAIAATLGFSVDESYTLANARQLSLSYFDHPPAQSWIAWAFIPFLGDGHALRLPFVFLFAGSSWLLYRLTGRLFGASAGVWAVLGLNLSAFFLLSPGTWIVPDGPLIFFQLAAALTLARAFFPDSAAPSPWATWILTGAFIGLAALSKYHAVLFGLGVLLYVLSMPDVRRVLLHPAPWLGALIALLVFSPVLIWNGEHGWASFYFRPVTPRPAEVSIPATSSSLSLPRSSGFFRGFSFRWRSPPGSPSGSGARSRDNGSASASARRPS